MLLLHITWFPFIFFLNVEKMFSSNVDMELQWMQA